MYKLIAVVLVCVLILSGSSFAISDVGFGGGGMLFLEDGKKPSFGYLVTGRFPWGINSKSIDINAGKVVTSGQETIETIIDADTTITFEVVTEVAAVYSNFKFDDYQELEGELLTTKVRKSLGFLNSYLEGGVTVWNLIAASKVSDEKNTIADGYYFGFNLQPLNGVQVNLGGHAIPRTVKPSTFALQFGFSLIF